MPDGICPFTEFIPGVNSHGGAIATCVGFCDHTAGGYLSTMRNPNFWNNAQTSVHFAIGRNGQGIQLVNIFQQSWGQGRDRNSNSISSSSPGISWSKWPDMNRQNPNIYLISTEHEDVESRNGQTVFIPGSQWTNVEYQMDLRIKHWCREEYRRVKNQEILSFGIDSLTGHHMFDPTNRAECPGRFWRNEYRTKLYNDLMGDEMFNVLAHGKLLGEIPTTDGFFDLTRFGLPLFASRVRLQVWHDNQEPLEFYHGLTDPANRDAGRVYAPYGIIEVIPSVQGRCYIIGNGSFDISPLGWYS